MKQKIKLTVKQSKALGMSPLVDKQMSNGEYRFRRMHRDGSGYIRVHAGDVGAWQNAHFHKELIELCAIQQGWLAYVWLENTSLKEKIYQAGEYFATVPGTAHNIYLPAGTITHTIKIGNTTNNDWFASPN